MGYRYLATHTGNFIIASMEPECAMKQIKRSYAIKNIGPPMLYLGGDCGEQRDYWTMGSKTYITKKVRKIKEIFSKLPKQCMAMEKGAMSELDTGDDCKLTDRKLFQMLIGIYCWIILPRWIDIMFATVFLSLF